MNRDACFPKAPDIIRIESVKTEGFDFESRRIKSSAKLDNNGFKTANIEVLGDVKHPKSAVVHGCLLQHGESCRP